MEQLSKIKGLLNAGVIKSGRIRRRDLSEMGIKEKYCKRVAAVRCDDRIDDLLELLNVYVDNGDLDSKGEKKLKNICRDIFLNDPKCRVVYLIDVIMKELDERSGSNERKNKKLYVKMCAARSSGADYVLYDDIMRLCGWYLYGKDGIYFMGSLHDGNRALFGEFRVSSAGVIKELDRCRKDGIKTMDEGDGKYITGRFVYIKDGRGYGEMVGTFEDIGDYNRVPFFNSIKLSLAPNVIDSKELWVN